MFENIVYIYRLGSIDLEPQFIPVFLWVYSDTVNHAILLETKYGGV